MKVAHICTSAISHKILLDKLELLGKKNYSVDLISSKEGFDPSISENTSVSIKFIDMSRKISPLNDLRSIYKLTKLIKKEDYNIVHTHTAKAGLIGRISATFAKTPLVLHTSHGLPFYKGQNAVKYKLYKTFEKIGTYFCDVILSQNHEDIHQLKNLNRKKPVYYEGNGIDLSKLNNEFNKYKELNKKELVEFNLSGKHVFLMAARFEEVKDHDFLLEGVKRMVEKNENLRPFIILLAGTGSLKSEFRDKVKEYRLEKHFNFLGYQSDIYKYITLADTVILTSKKEGLPRIIMESMAARKLVIGTNVLGTKELIEDDRTGLLVEYRKIEELSEKLHKAINEDLTYLKQAGYKKVLNNFTEQHVVDRLDKVYSDYLKAHN